MPSVASGRVPALLEGGGGLPCVQQRTKDYILQHIYWN